MAGGILLHARSGLLAGEAFASLSVDGHWAGDTYVYILIEAYCLQSAFLTTCFGLEMNIFTSSVNTKR